MKEKNLFTSEIEELILKIIKRGNCAEIKKENNKLVIVEIERHMRAKTSITG